MPVPKPTADESQDTYMHRCMGFLMNEPDSQRSQEQCVAICMSLWRDRGKNSADPDLAESRRQYRGQGKLSMPLEIKSLTAREFEGYGSVFGNVDLGGDIVVPGAFAKSLNAHAENGSLPQMFWMHDPTRVPGKWLAMSEDDHGLYVKGQLAPTPLGDEMHALMKMDAVRGLSIGYMVGEDAYDKQGNRLLKAVDLWETSLVSLAMNPMARVAHVKSQLSQAGEYVPSPREWEQSFRDMGCSRRMARTLVYKLFGGDESSGTLDAALFGKGDDGVMPPESRWDAADSELGRALETLRDTVIADSLSKLKF
jgi:Escherichia/Staphylococcus phage prohead protease